MLAIFVAEVLAMLLMRSSLHEVSSSSLLSKQICFLPKQICRVVFALMMARWTQVDVRTQLEVLLGL